MSQHPSAAPFWKKLGLQLAAFVGIFVLVIWAATAGYQAWKSRSVEKEAVIHFQSGRFQAAHSAAERALIENPESVTAARIAAESLDRMQSPGAVEAWARVAQLDKGGTGAAVQWARAALRWNRENIAVSALQMVPEDARTDGAYHDALGDTMTALGRHGDAEAAYRKAVKFAPENPGFALKLASIVATHSNVEADIAAAVSSLQKLAQDPAQKAPALRALAEHFIRRKDFASALATNARLLELRPVQTADRIRQLGILRNIDEAKCKTALEELQAGAREAGEVSAILKWMNENAMAAAAVEWTAQLEPRLTRTPEIARRAAESHLALADWRNLRRRCDELESWGAFEHLRHAYAARALREMNDPINAGHRWDAAIGAANEVLQTTTELLKLAAAWGWKDEQRDILWDSANRIDAQWALAKLTEIYTAERSAEGLLRVHTRETELNPANDAARNRMVRLSLLIERDPENAAAQARMLARRNPGNAEIAATLALAELKSGHSAEALAAFANVPAAGLTEPQTALFHGLALFATGRESDAATAFTLAKTRTMLPEESRLLPPAFRDATPNPAGR